MATDPRPKDGLAVVPDSDSLRPTDGAFFLTPENTLSPESADKPNENIVLTQEQIRNRVQILTDYLPAGVYEKMHAQRRETFDLHAHLLLHTINVHDTDHQDRDAIGVLWLGQQFPEKVDPELLEAVVVGSLIHDIGYMEATDRFVNAQIDKIKKDLLLPNSPQAPLITALLKWEDFRDQFYALKNGDVETAKAGWEKPGAFPKEVSKIALDPHAPIGKEIIEMWYEDPDMHEIFARWTPEQRHEAAVAIRDHSNGSEYDPFATGLAAKLLRAIDKLDNTKERTVGMITKDTLKDRKNYHRFVPTAIQEMHYELNKKSKTLFVHYHVDPSTVENAMRAYDDAFVYSKETYLADFERAYGEKSVPIAAEVVASLFAKKGELYDPDARLVVVHHFTDGDTVSKPYQPYETEPAFTGKGEKGDH